MSPAIWPRDRPDDEKLLVIRARSGGFSNARVRDLGSQLRAGDLLVVNDSATLPASLPVDGGELRLLALQPDDSWWAVLFGAGDWRTKTEHRPAPPTRTAGEVIAVGSINARIEEVSDVSPRLVRVRFSVEGEALWSAIYALGAPVQYAYLKDALRLWHVQNRYAGRPWSVELPSAGRPLTWKALMQLRERGVELAFLTHAAGLSSTGDARLDALLPLPERYEIPASTVEAIHRTQAYGGRVIAVGTSVTRALEGNVETHGKLTAGAGVTDLRISQRTQLSVVTGLLTGMHELDSSHFSLLQAFAPVDVLKAAYGAAEKAGYLVHEFGDSNLILPS